MIIRQQQTRCRHLLGRTSFTCLVMVLPWLVGLAVTWPAHSQAAQAATACVVNNANFEAASFRPWYLQVDASQGADAQLNVDSGYDSPKAVRVDITQRGIQDWHVQLSQRDVPMNPGRRYTLAFWAHADQDRVLAVQLQQDSKPFIQI